MTPSIRIAGAAALGFMIGCAVAVSMPPDPAPKVLLVGAVVATNFGLAWAIRVRLEQRAQRRREPLADVIPIDRKAA